MRKWYFYQRIALTLLLGISLINTVKAKDIFFISQQNYGSWILTKNYNSVSIHNIKQSSPVVFNVNPYEYIMNIVIDLPSTIPNPPSSIELDIGDFTRNLERQGTSLSYKTTFENSESEQFINEITQQKFVSITVNDDQPPITISLQGMENAVDSMDNFAKDHYILLPYPFVSKLDVYSSMPIPNDIPTDLYPLYRQQAALDDECNQSKQKGISTATTCRAYQAVIHTLNKAGICKIEEKIPEQLIGKKDSGSYKWQPCKPTK